MATKKQTRANKENAQRSTGPRTASGKAKSSMNALKHGLRAQATVLPDENLDEFELLVSELEDQFQPRSAIEWTLLRQLADAEWRMRRVPGLEAAVLAAKLNETVRYYQAQPERLPEDEAEADMVLIGDAAESDACNGDTFSKLSRYEARLSHRYFKALEHLQKLQSNQQRATNPENNAPAAPAPNEGATGAAIAGGAGGDKTIAKGDPSPAREGRVHCEGNPPKQSQPPSPAPDAGGDRQHVAGGAGPDNRIAKGDPSPARKARVHCEGNPPKQSPAPETTPAKAPQRQARPQCAKRTQSRPKRQPQSPALPAPTGRTVRFRASRSHNRTSQNPGRRASASQRP